MPRVPPIDVQQIRQQRGAYALPAKLGINHEFAIPDGSVALITMGRFGQTDRSTIPQRDAKISPVPILRRSDEALPGLPGDGADSRFCRRGAIIDNDDIARVRVMERTNEDVEFRIGSQDLKSFATPGPPERVAGERSALSTDARPSFPQLNQKA